MAQPAAAILALLVVMLAGCGSGTEGASSGSDGDELHVVGYPGLGVAYEEALEPAFEGTFAGKGVGFDNSFGPSDEQVLAVADGQLASVIQVEQTGEMEQLVEAGKVAANWDEQLFGGIASWTPIVFIVRKGNPKRIHNVRDILDRDVDVLTPNPFSSDAGRWNVMDVYATLIHERESEAEALAGVKAVLEKAVAQPDGAADAFDAFLRGQGDVLLAYESEAIQAVEAGEALSYVLPQQTMRVDTPIAVTENAPRPAARRFLKFLWSGGGQRLWAKRGYRPVDQEFQALFKKRFPFRETLSVQRFGGWSKVNEDFFDPTTGSVAAIERELGIATD